MSIHPSAIVDPGAEIGAGVSIGPYAVLGPGVRLGDGCRIHAHAVLEHATLGPNCEVYPHASIGLPAQHLRYKGEPSSVIAGSGTIFREGVTVHRGTAFDQSVTRIGDNCYFMALSHVAHDCKVGNNVTMANGSLLAGHVEVGDSTFISGLAAVHQFCRIGTGAMVAGGAMAVQDVAPFCVAQGDRAVIRGINLVGMRRLKYDREAIRDLKEAYRTVFLSNLLLGEALASPELNAPSAAVRAFRAFLSAPKRGFARTAAGAASESAEEVAS